MAEDVSEIPVIQSDNYSDLEEDSNSQLFGGLAAKIQHIEGDRGKFQIDLGLDIGLSSEFVIISDPQDYDVERDEQKMRYRSCPFLFLLVGWKGGGREK